MPCPYLLSQFYLYTATGQYTHTCQEDDSVLYYCSVKMIINVLTSFENFWRWENHVCQLQQVCRHLYSSTVTPADVSNRTYTINNTPSLLTITKSCMFLKITAEYMEGKERGEGWREGGRKEGRKEGREEEDRRKKEEEEKTRDAAGQ